ncbi:diaminobutyrate acetyltransferase [Actinomycetaceae bacterium Sa1BUA1]|uniref:L-2,4-diaminobutyric acid acetyltransferase n=1 Tax=Oceanitalea stevensii TaxID=2763072 RepID=A0ABR8Z5D7_9MICO|nr:diaminobutyrate acetyltransferase [Oceanitalea stevensii]
MPPATPAAPRVPSAAAPDTGSGHPPVTVRAPEPAEGADMWRLARDSGALDLNTSYAYLLLARDFARTCRVAVVDGEVVGFLLGYRRPEEPSTLFVWQVAVDPAQRGRRLAARLLADAAAGAGFVEASITADNTASQRLFESFAAERGAPLVRSELFAAADFPDAGHETEGLVRIGPLEPIES